MGILYTILIYIFLALVKVASLFNTRARKWVRGRRGWENALREKFPGDDKPLWVHCASLGEFEQGRPVIEKLKQKYPGRKIIVTFFSPSGYDVMKDWPVADYIGYLPADTPLNALKFLDIVSPGIAIFIKYEFWINFIAAIHKKGIPLYLVSAIFRPRQYFFRWYGRFFRNQLGKFSKIFVQDKKSKEILSSAGIENVIISGDTRFDRVAQVAENYRDLPLIEKFSRGEKILLAGSSWPADEEIIAWYLNQNPGAMKWIFAPHEIDQATIRRLESVLKVKSARYSEGEAGLPGARVLLIDNIGTLSLAYRYASIAVVGGGFGKGIHNILEPACWGIPVLFGPDHKKFREAVELLDLGGAFTFTNREEFSKIIGKLLTDLRFYESAAAAARKYIAENKGVTARIIGEIT